MKLLPIILAAGQGTRMRSQLPKVLHPIGGKPMLQHVVDSCKKLSAEKLVVIYGHGGNQVREKLNDSVISWVEQNEQKGTGHAVAQAMDHIQDDHLVLVAYGDVPLIQADTLRDLAHKLERCDLCVLTTMLDNPTGYGRVVRKNNSVCAIVEEKDATESIREIKEVNTGFIAAKGKNLKNWLQQLSPNNAQGEYYLTDCIELAVNEGKKVETSICPDVFEVQGVNNRLQQAELEREYQRKQAENLMLSGVTLLDPNRIDLRGVLETGQDVVIDVNVVFEGQVKLGNNVVIEPYCHISNCEIGSNVHIKANSVLENAHIGDDCDVGPFARLRPGSVLAQSVRVGNFVEVKKSTIGEGSKVNHLSYVGDTIMGSETNIGAGTITCNYDGANKHQTRIGDHVFVGSSTQLIAPVTVGDGATIGAGSTIARDVPAEKLTLSRAKQVTLDGWTRPEKKNK